MRWAIAIALFFWAATAYSADSEVETNADSNTEQTNGVFGPFWISETTAAIVYHDSGDDPSYRCTTNGGVSFTADADFEATTLEHLTTYFDGTLVHVVWSNSAGTDDVTYANLNISTCTPSTPVQVEATTFTGSSIDHRLAIGKSASGLLYLAYNTAAVNRAWVSDDTGATWSAIATLYDSATVVDYALIKPANTANDDDVAAVYWDIDDGVYIRMYDASANSWTESSVQGSVTGDSQYYNIDAAVRESDGAILVAFHNAPDNAADDIQTFEIIPNSIASPTVTAKTNVVTNVAESAQIALMIDQGSEDVYVAYLKGNTNWQIDTDLVYHVSTDAMSTWGSEQAYSETTDDIRNLSAGNTVSTAGGYFQPLFYNDDLTSLWNNLVNDVAIAQATAGPTNWFMVVD